jgi:chemotaxis protein methyltransferase WspC
MQAVEAILSRIIGLDPASIGLSAVARAIRQRMDACGCPSEADYLHRLDASPEEAEALVEEVIVPETWFFRDREPFAFLGEYAATQWAPAHPHGRLRLLSAPCATG